jgi:hypothetical protein
MGTGGGGETLSKLGEGWRARIRFTEEHCRGAERGFGRRLLDASLETAEASSMIRNVLGLGDGGCRGGARGGLDGFGEEGVSRSWPGCAVPKGFIVDCLGGYQMMIVDCFFPAIMDHRRFATVFLIVE